MIPISISRSISFTVCSFLGFMLQKYKSFSTFKQNKQRFFNRKQLTALVSRLYKIKGNNAIFIVYANFSMIAGLPSGKATRNKETMHAKYIYSIYNILSRVRIRAYIIYVIYYFLFIYYLYYYCLLCLHLTLDPRIIGA